MLIISTTASKYAAAVNSLQRMESTPINCVLALLEEKVEALLEAAKDQPFAQSVREARELYGVG